MSSTAVGDANSKPFAATPDKVSYFLMERCFYYRWVLSQQIRDQGRNGVLGLFTQKIKRHFSFKSMLLLFCVLVPEL